MTEAHGSTARLAAGLCGLFAVATFLWLALWAIAPMLLGWHPVVITSDSMGPAVRAGDVVVARPHTGAGIGEGTVAVFEDPDGRGLVTHRVWATHPDGTYTTKGDANRVPDSVPLRPEQVVGVGRLLVPLVGLPVLWLQTGAWMRLALVLGSLASSIWLAQWAFGDPAPGPGSGEPAPRPGRELRSRSPARLGSLLGTLLLIGVVAVPHARAALTDVTASQGNSFQASWQYDHDVAVTDLRAPASARVNVAVQVEVDVENLGKQDETFDVELRNVTKGTVIGTQTVSLASRAAATLGFSWTPEGPPGQQVLEAEAILPSDEDLSNNLDSTTVQVTVR